MKISIDATVNAPINKVWNAWTTPDKITQWNFATPEWCCPKAEIDLKPGGKFSYRMEAKDGSMGFDFAGEFTAVEELSLIKFHLGDNREVEVRFTENGEAVNVFETFEAEDENSAEQQKQGWQNILNNFKSHVENTQKDYEVNKDVDSFLDKAKNWRKEIEALRGIILKTKLEEGIKWNKPCYSHNSSNVAIIQPFKNHLALMFFKGKLLKDPKKLLVDNGPNSQSAMRLEFESVKEITKLSATIKSYIKEAVALEESGQRVEFKKKPEPLPEELKTVFKKKPKLKAAFEKLTPGRQRGYILHFAGAKQSATIVSRIEKCAPKILAGKGLNDRQ